MQCLLCNALLYQLSYMTSSILPLEEIFSDTTTPRVSGQWHWAPYNVNIWKNCINQWLELVGCVEFSCTVVTCEHWVSQKAATTFCQLPYMAYMRGHYFWRNHGFFNQSIEQWWYLKKSWIVGMDCWWWENLMLMHGGHHWWGAWELAAMERVQKCAQEAAKLLL